MHKVILGSASGGRSSILKNLNIPHLVLPSDVDESTITHSDPYETLTLRTQKKSENIISRKTLPNASLLITADSGVILERTLYGKPNDITQGQKYLALLSGKTHILATALEVHDLTQKNTCIHQSLTKSEVTFATLSKQSITRYTKLFPVTRFAGGYAINDTPWEHIAQVAGSITNVIGLPIEPLLPIFYTYKIL